GLADGRVAHVLTCHDNSVQGAQIANRAMDYLSFHDIRCERVVISGKGPKQAITEKADELDASLVVMGAYGKNTLTEFFFGSLTTYTLQHCWRPLFLFH